MSTVCVSKKWNIKGSCWLPGASRLALPCWVQIDPAWLNPTGACLWRNTFLWKHFVLIQRAPPTLPATGLVSKPLFIVWVWRQNNHRQRSSIGAIVLWLHSNIPSRLTERLRSKASALQLWDYLRCRVVLPADYRTASLTKIHCLEYHNLNIWFDLTFSPGKLL